MVENIYTIIPRKTVTKWNAGLQEPDALAVIPLQREFFNKCTFQQKRTVVIISDGMRLRLDVNCTSVQDNPKCKDSLSLSLCLVCCHHIHGWVWRHCSA